MARDDYLLYADHYRPAALRLYQWDPPTISLGYFQSIAAVEELPDSLQSLAVVRRQTGGGAILHDREITYCLVVSDELPVARQAPEKLYRMVHELWREILTEDYPLIETAPDSAPMPSPRTGPFFCFERPGRTDLTLSGAKLLGSAQRRIAPTAGSGASVLQHGSLMLGQRFPGHPGASLDEPEPQRIDRWLGAFIERLAQGLELEVTAAEWSGADRPEIERRRQRFASSAWTARR
jgi:lipoate-protein ligase A